MKDRETSSAGLGNWFQNIKKIYEPGKQCYRVGSSHTKTPYVGR